MPNPLVECIPNFSEARRPEVVDAILEAITSVPGVTMLDRHSDMDHNRTVLTYIGPPAAVEEATFLAIAKAAELINLDWHRGEHPRMGATDVVPFVPIRDISMQECVEMARRVGKRVGDALQIPVYLYEEAAARPERKNLEDIRRGEYEGLKAEIGVRPERRPDFGPEWVGPAGGTVIGARQPLIAFNVYLTTNNVTIAQKIARSLRFSSGGLRYVKALGLLVEGTAQVSMNLTNFRQTPIARVVEMVRREAARYGVAVRNSELVGLIPQDALLDAAVWYTQLDMFDPDEQVLETRLNTALAQQAGDGNNETVENSFIESLSKGTSSPGGGSAAAQTGAAAAALVSMVARLTVGRKKYADVENRMWQIVEQSEALRSALTQAVKDDAAAFEDYLKAVRMPKETPAQQAERANVMEQATLETIEMPFSVCKKAVEVLRLAVEVVQTGNVNAISDGASGAALARASLTSSAYNVRINCPNLQDQSTAQTFIEQVNQLEKQAAQLETSMMAALNERGKLAW